MRPIRSWPAGSGRTSSAGPPPVTANHRVGLTVRLDAPQADGGWLLSVEATGVDKHPMPVEHALVVASGTKSQQVEAQLRRLERLLPVLRRPSTRRGQVVLDGDEAVELMFTHRAVADRGRLRRHAAGRVDPPAPTRSCVFSPRRSGPSQVGVQQLANVRWSVFFDDLELDAAGIAALAKEAKPLVQVRGRWVHIDRADLTAAASALAERASITQLSGAAVIRHAVGLEGTALAGPVRVDGSGWAADLLRGATTHPPAPIDTPDGFAGQLRSYQAEAAGWLGFLDRAGLGGCLAMDMGLGKTPDPAGPPAGRPGPRPDAGDLPAGGAEQLGQRGAPLHPGPEGGRAPRAASGRGRRHQPAGGHLRRGADHLRHRRARHRDRWPPSPGAGSSSTRPRSSRTTRATPPRSCAASPPTPGWPSPAPRSRTASATSGPSSTSPTRAWSDRATPSSSTSRRGGSTPPTARGRPAPAAGGRSRPPGSSEESALRALNGLLIFRRTKSEPEIAAELPDKVDKLDHCSMTAEQIGLYQAVVNRLLEGGLDGDSNQRKGAVLAAITALKQICDHPAAYLRDDDDQKVLAGRSGKLARLEEIVADVFVGRRAHPDLHPLRPLG